VLALPEGARVHQIAWGPDGNLWASVPEADRLLRITPEGAIQPFDLPRGTRPGELLPYPHGRMLFLSLKGDRLGSIRAVASAGQAWPEWDGGPGANPAVAPEPAPEQPLDAGALADLRARTEAALAQARAPEGEEPPDPDEADAGSAFQEPAVPDPPPAAAARPPTPRERLGARNIVLTAQATRHILTRHRHSLDNGNSRFLARYSQAEALDALLADGLLQAERTGLLGKVRMWDRRERGCTFCTLDQPVGTCRREGRDLPTRTFLVVTAETYDAPTRRWVHGIVTAYPVPEEG
jgi:hypothetical protein